MKRELFGLRRGDCGCCPGHDKFPGEAYANRRSKRARSRNKQAEHQLVRQIRKRELQREMKEC